MKLLFPVLRKLSLPLRIRPSFLIIGAQKSGTSALHYYLSQHPNLVPAKIKEMDFFSGEAKYAEGGSAYHQGFPLRNVRFRLAYEASPSYLHNPNAPQRIYQYNSKLKLIAVLRDPVQRAFSAWKMYSRYFAADRDWYIKWMASRNGPDWNSCKISLRMPAAIADFNAYVEQELEAISSGKSVEAPILSHGLYYEQVERFALLFGRDQFFLFASDELQSRTIGVLSEIEVFLNIPPHDWTCADLKPVFVGDVRDVRDVDVYGRAIYLLKEYYREDCELLQKNYNISFKGSRLTASTEY